MVWLWPAARGQTQSGRSKIRGFAPGERDEFPDAGHRNRSNLIQLAHPDAGNLRRDFRRRVRRDVLFDFCATQTVMRMKDTTNPDLTVKVTGYQWKWGYEYLQGPGTGVQFLSTLTTPR